MLLQFQNYIFEKYHFVKVNYSFNDAILTIFQVIFPGEVSEERASTLIDAFKV